MVDQRSDLRLETRENRVRTLPWASSGHATTRLMSAQRRRPPILIFATKPLDWRKTHRVVAAAAHRGTRTAPCEESEPVSARRAQPEDPSLTVSCPRNSESRTVDQRSRAGPWVALAQTRMTATRRRHRIPGQLQDLDSDHSDWHRRDVPFGAGGGLCPAVVAA